MSIAKDNKKKILKSLTCVEDLLHCLGGTIDWSGTIFSAFCQNTSDVQQNCLKDSITFKLFFIDT